MYILKIIAILLATQSVFAKFIFYNKYNNVYAAETNLMKNYPNALERLILLKKDNFKVFYGGPINSAKHHGRPYGPKWLMPIMFEDNGKIHAVMDAVFINCTPEDAEGAEIVITEINDLRLKLRISEDKEYQVVHGILYPKTNQKRILLRICDFANVYYPEIFIKNQKIPDTYINTAVKYLRENFKTRNGYHVLELSDSYTTPIEKETNTEIVYRPYVYTLHGKKVSIQKILLKNDVWKLYYVIKNDAKNVCPGTLRIDSGCVSGQIYDDDACDCYDQFNDALKIVANDKDAMIIHIPAQDGRGFGTAPKAETEIYKIGGKGRAHTTNAIDTVEAAKLLYGEGVYDLRTYDGVAKVLNILGVKNVKLITDNVLKFETLKLHGFNVERVKTKTEKESCKEHIDAKHKSPLYFQGD